MAISAVQVVRKMRGGCQSQLVLGDDDNFWIVKFRNNPQHIRVLANEMIITGIACALGLTVPLVAIIEVPAYLLEGMYYELHGSRATCYAPGLQFGSRLVGGLLPGLTLDFLPTEDFLRVQNLHEFAGMLCLDKWAANCDGRQAVFHRRRKTDAFRAAFIDHGFCFGCGDWTFTDAPLRGKAYYHDVYSRVTGWDSFEPWITRIEEMDPQTLWKIAEAVPTEWYGNDLIALERLIELMIRRRPKVRNLITAFRLSASEFFPLWIEKSQIGVGD